MHTSRREFLKYAVVTASTVLLPYKLPGADRKNDDREILKATFERAGSLGLSGKPIGEVVAAIGLSFLGAPYAAHTLEVPGPERLVVNLREFDCVTFVESVLAIARCITQGTMSWDEFTRQLTLIRYRDGEIAGYPSRLHYFSDWIDNNERKRVVRNVTQELGGVVLAKTINYMTAHRTAYRQLADDEVFARVRLTEEQLNTRVRYYLPKHRVDKVSNRLLDGDVIAITTSIEGLDVAHTGFACRRQGVLRFLHAPLSGGTIQLSKRSLASYLAQHPGRTGIMIARPVAAST
ncbi:MAG TPA: N-acetylmuramoyl-L-alanine amidase-like domain-containing protein [Bacteroidota bacterium]|nr:N-acetylmuramoyl-L-alanine amidase-like domain-containing protein [Bacteroidota bacterium]